jgi:hypothetical protein
LTFALQSTTGLDTVEVAVDVYLQQNRWMVRGATRGRRSRPFEAERF